MYASGRYGQNQAGGLVLEHRTPPLNIGPSITVDLPGTSYFTVPVANTAGLTVSLPGTSSITIPVANSTGMTVPVNTQGGGAWLTVPSAP